MAGLAQIFVERQGELYSIREATLNPVPVVRIEGRARFIESLSEIVSPYFRDDQGRPINGATDGEVLLDINIDGEPDVVRLTIALN